MRLTRGLAYLFAIFPSHYVSNRLSTAAQGGAPSQWPLHDNGLNDVVQWDHYSFKVNGKRLFVFSGEIHYWRVPGIVIPTYIYCLT
jgi:hypothetical protein